MLINEPYEKIKDVVIDKKFPMVICDLDAFNKNLEKVGQDLKKAKKVMRLCTKSVRVPQLIKIVKEKEFVNGVFTYNSAEALFLAEKYQFKDILLGYPIGSRIDAEELSKAAEIENVKITIVIDALEQLNLLEAAAAEKGVRLNILIDIDVADRFMGRNIGVYRSPLRSPEDVIKMAQEIGKRPQLKYRGIMGYEAQNASLGDNKFLYRYVKKRSRANVNQWREDIVSTLKNAGFQPEIVNGGGSGCYLETAAEPSITEIGIGSLLFKSHLFDSINSLNDFVPALFFALQIVRKPNKNIATAFSGGYISSGSSRALPIPMKPEKLKTIKDEAFGEVQTPFKFNPKTINLNIGDPVFCRFGKAGEPLEHFEQVYIYSSDKIIDTFPTYRGLGKRFS